LFPDQSVAVDVALFEAAAHEALRAGDEALLRAAIESCGGDLLPEDLYEEWADGPRQRVRQLRTDLLRRLHRWDDLVQLDRTDEEAHLELMRALTARGDRHGALRQFERLDRALAGELGVAPSKEAVALRDADWRSPPWHVLRSRIVLGLGGLVCSVTGRMKRQAVDWPV
jgi:DNA-binding SARP family transcriptional activator